MRTRPKSKLAYRRPDVSTLVALDKRDAHEAKVAEEEAGVLDRRTRGASEELGAQLCRQLGKRRMTTLRIGERLVEAFDWSLDANEERKQRKRHLRNEIAQHKPAARSRIGERRNRRNVSKRVFDRRRVLDFAGERQRHRDLVARW